MVAVSGDPAIEPGETFLFNLSAPVDVLTGSTAGERSRHPLPPVSEIDVPRHFLDTRGVTAAVAARGAGIAVSTVSSILAGKRKMTRGHLEALACYYHVAPAVFLSTK